MKKEYIYIVGAGLLIYLVYTINNVNTAANNANTAADNTNNEVTNFQNSWIGSSITWLENL